FEFDPDERHRRTRPAGGNPGAAGNGHSGVAQPWPADVSGERSALTESDPALTRLNVALTALLVFVIVVVGCALGFALWFLDVSAPQVDVLGSGNRLSLLVTDGPARLLLATGDNPDQFDNALARFRPIFARRVDVLLMAGANHTLNVPLAAN